MRFCKAVPRVASLPELRTYNCQQCGVTATEAEEPKSVATANLLSRVASLGSPYARRGEVIRLDTQITHKSGLANNLWVQMAALLIVTIAVIAFAAKFIW